MLHVVGNADTLSGTRDEPVGLRPIELVCLYMIQECAKHIAFHVHLRLFEKRRSETPAPSGKSDGLLAWAFIHGVCYHCVTFIEPRDYLWPAGFG